MRNPTTQMITELELQSLLKVSRPTLYRWRKTMPSFPAPLKIGPRAIRYNLADVQAFIEGRQKA